MYYIFWRTLCRLVPFTGPMSQNFSPQYLLLDSLELWQLTAFLQIWGTPSPRHMVLQPSQQAVGHSVCLFSPTADTKSAAGIGGERMGHAIEQTL